MRALIGPAILVHMQPQSGEPGGSGPVVLDMDDPDLRMLVTRLVDGGRVEALGGTMSRNVHLVDLALVLRVHAPFVSATRVRAERQLKRALLDAGLPAARPRSLDGRDLLKVAGRVAEVEQYVPHRVPAPGWDAYRAMFATVSCIHRVLDCCHVPRPAVSTYGAPGTLRRHLGLLSQRQLTPRSRQHVEEVAALVRAVERSWVPARDLPETVVHGVPRLENLPTGQFGEPVVLDLGFAARRPRIHDLAYATAWILLGPDDAGVESDDDVRQIRRCVSAYEEGAPTLSTVERQAFDGYLAGVCLYQSTVAAHLPDPDSHLAQPGVRHMVEIARRVMTHRGILI